MKPEYDFSRGIRGKFFRAEAELRLPVYLDPEVQSYLAARAAAKGVPLGELVNALLKQEIQIIVCEVGLPARSIPSMMSVSNVDMFEVLPEDGTLVVTLWEDREVCMSTSRRWACRFPNGVRHK